MANEGSTKPTYSLETLLARANADAERAYEKLEGANEELLRVRGLLQRLFTFARHEEDCPAWGFHRPTGAYWAEGDEKKCYCGVGKIFKLTNSPQGAESADIGKLDSVDRWTPELRLFHKLWGKAVGTSDYVKSDWQKLEHELFIKPTLAGSAETGGEKADLSSGMPPDVWLNGGTQMCCNKSCPKYSPAASITCRRCMCSVDRGESA